MPFVEEIVSLVVDGQVLRGWQEVSVSRSMQNAVISFSLKATNPTWSTEAKALRHGKEIEVRTSQASGPWQPGGGDLLCKGYVDNYSAKYGCDSKSVTVSGRSKAADAVDCPPVKHKTGRVEKKALDQVAKELDEFGIEWKTDQKLDPIPKVQRRPDDTVFDTVEREARRLGLMLAGQPDGSVMITRAGSKRHAGAIVMGGPPVESMDVQVNLSSKRSPIVVRGQRSIGTGDESLRQQIEEVDQSVGRHRPLVVILEGDAPKKELKKRGKWERLRSAGFGVNVSTEMSSWRDDAGQLWDPGRLIATVCAEEDIDQDLTLSTVTFKQDIDNGTVASLALVDPRSHGGKKARGGKGSDSAYDPGGGIDEE